MLYLSYRPHPLLHDVIDYLWLLSDAPGHAKERIVPSGTLELVINLREDAIRIYDRTKPIVCRTFPGIVLSGAYTAFFVIDTVEHALMMGVHFKPGGAMSFLGARADELTDRHVDVESLWGATAKQREQRATQRSARTMALGYILLAVVVVTVLAGLAYAALQPAPPPGLTDADIRTELRKGNRLVAIRWYRILHHVGLKSAREAVERLDQEP